MLLQVCDKSHNGGPNAEAFLVHCARLSMKSKSVVFRQGEPSEDLYLILDGSVSVIVDDIEDP